MTEFIITLEGSIVNLMNGFFAFWMMRFAHNVVENPEFEKKVWKRWEDRKLKNNQKKY